MALLHFNTYMGLQPILNELICGILEAPTLAELYSLDQHQQPGKRVLVCGLYEIRQKVHDKEYKTFGVFAFDLKQLRAAQDLRTAPAFAGAR